MQDCLNLKNIVTLGEFLSEELILLFICSLSFFLQTPLWFKVSMIYQFSIIFLFKMLCLSSTHPIVCTMYMYINLSMRECPLEFSRSCAHTNECLCNLLCHGPTLCVYEFGNRQFCSKLFWLKPAKRVAFLLDQHVSFFDWSFFCVCCIFYLCLKGMNLPVCCAVMLSVYFFSNTDDFLLRKNGCYIYTI